MKNPRKSTPAIKPLQKWEYRVEHAKCGSMGTNALNAFGVDGWELCATIATPDTPSDLSSAWPAVVIYIFKRPS